MKNIINLLSTNNKKIKIDTETPRCNRAKLDTGYFCNYDCEFCYYRDRLGEKTEFDIVKQRADYLLNYGITQIDLSGGESSVSPDWFKILDYCSERFEHVSCLSHGGKFYNKDFLKESKEHGLKEILFSLHGSNSDTHDEITNRKGSFKRIIGAIQNAKELGLTVRINCTVYQKNYLVLSNEYAKLINELNPLEVNFILLNYWDDVKVEPINYENITTEIKRCIDNLNKNLIINVRYVPYCHMIGYEKYVCNQYQHIYDIYDWNKEMYVGDEKNGIDVSKKYSELEKLNFAYKKCGDYRTRFYKKDKVCLECKYFYICDGFENEIKEPKYNPVFGEKIVEVTHFRKNHFK